MQSFENRKFAFQPQLHHRIMTKQLISILMFPFFVLVHLPDFASAAVTEPDSVVVACDPEEENELSYKIIPYVWMSSLSGDVIVKGTKTKINAGFGDILEDLEVGFISYVEAEGEHFWVYVDAVFLDVDDALSTSSGELDLSFNQTILDAGLGYTLKRWSIEQHEGTVALGAYAGVRYNRLELELDLKGVGDFDGSRNWVDPLVGLRLKANFANDWSIFLTSDFGGFGLGSEFATKLQGVVGYHFTDWFTIWAGYRYMYMNYMKGAGSDEFRYDMNLYGPLLAFGFNF